jgi:hypothetical protein
MWVERGKVREFNEACGVTGPTADEVHPMFLVTAAFWQSADSLPPALRDREVVRQLHGEQEFRYPERLPRVGEEFTCTVSVEREFVKEGKRGGAMRLLVRLIEFVASDGTLVAQSRATIIQPTLQPGEDRA